MCDMVLIQCPLDEGLSKKDYMDMLNIVDNLPLSTIDFHVNNTSAYGFITYDAFEKFDFDSNNIAPYVLPILNDQDLENDSCMYNFLDIVFYLSCSK